MSRRERRPSTASEAVRARSRRRGLTHRLCRINHDSQIQGKVGVSTTSISHFPFPILHPISFFSSLHISFRTFLCCLWVSSIHLSATTCSGFCHYGRDPAPGSPAASGADYLPTCLLHLFSLTSTSNGHGSLLKGVCTDTALAAFTGPSSSL